MPLKCCRKLPKLDLGKGTGSDPVFLNNFAVVVIWCFLFSIYLSSVFKGGSLLAF